VTATIYQTAAGGPPLFLQHEEPEVIFAEGRWNEGPCHFPAWRCVIWSDIPNDRLMRYDEITRSVSVFREPAHNANGNAVDRQGRLVTCEHATRRVTRTEFDGSVRVLADRFGAGRLNSPNDVVVRSDGTIWFTDPHYGINIDYFGRRAAAEQERAAVYRLDPATGRLDAVITSMVQPNGLAFTPDERALLVVDSGRTLGPEHPAHIRRFEFDADGAPRDCGVVVEATAGIFDGFRIDDEGRIWAAAGDGVHCHAADGTLLGRILLGGPAINLCFGGPKRNLLYVCMPARVVRVPVRARGIDPFSPPAEVRP
jgi:gluconolactonase